MPFEGAKCPDTLLLSRCCSIISSRFMADYVISCCRCRCSVVMLGLMTGGEDGMAAGEEGKAEERYESMQLLFFVHKKKKKKNVAA